jgi:hypothetical protein
MHLTHRGLSGRRFEQPGHLRSLQDDIRISLDEFKHSLDVAESLPTRLLEVSTQLQALKEGISDFAAEQKVLDSMDYPKRPARFDAILDAHRQTFRWFLSDQATSPSPSNRQPHDGFWHSESGILGSDQALDVSSSRFDPPPEAMRLHQWLENGIGIFGSAADMGRVNLP